MRIIETVVKREVVEQEVWQPGLEARRRAIDEMLAKHGVASGRVPRSYPRPGVGRFSCCQSYNG